MISEMIFAQGHRSLRQQKLPVKAQHTCAKCNLVAFLQCPDVWADGGLWVCLGQAMYPHMGSEGGQQIRSLRRLPLLGTLSCFLLPFYKAASYLDAWVQYALRLNHEDNLTILDGRPQVMSQSKYKPTILRTSSPNPWPFSFSSRETRRQTARPHYVHLRESRKGKNTTCHPTLSIFPGRAGHPSLPIILQVPRQRNKKKKKKNSLSHASESLIFCQTEMKNKPNLSCHRILKCLWQFYQSMQTCTDSLKKSNCSLSSVIYKQH